MPLHADSAQLSPDSTGIDDLTNDYNDSVNIHDSHSSGLVGKFRSSLKNKISVKGMSGLVKPSPRATTKKTEDEDGDKERTDEDERRETSEGLEISENVENPEADVVERSPYEGQEVEETVETTTHTVEETVEVKKKKKKKKRKPRDEEVEQQEIQVVESTPVKTGVVSGGVKLPDFEESPVVTVETEELSYEVTTEEQQSSASGKVKKTKRRTHKKKTQQDVDDTEVY